MQNRVYGLIVPILLSSFGFILLQTALIIHADVPNHTGLIEDRPVELIGIWTIDGVEFETDANTEFDEEDGPLLVGTCADVEYVINGDVNQAIHIESTELSDCNGGDDDDDDHMQTYGHLDSFPTDLLGDWVVDGITYTAVITTEFEEENGPFAVGACVEVEYIAGVRIAIEIETEDDYKCDGNGQNWHEIEGILDSFPPSLIGDWVVDGITYTADINTHFEQEDGPFFTGGCVEVKYDPATLWAAEIETTEPDDCDDSDPEQQFFGLIEFIPAEITGTWTISGVDFVVTSDTELDEEDGPLVVGVCVQVEYVVANGSNLATEIETESPYHCNGGSYTNETYGLIDNFPADLYGTWVIGGVSYEAVPGVTEFDQEDVPFAVGVCVEVEYYVTGGVFYCSRN